MRRDSALAGLLLVLVVAVWLRSPFITAGLPFLYQEDEAHHFQRVVQMVKTGSYNPDYFNKPSLHFYLRMPVVAAAFVAAVRAGEIRRVEDLVTKDAAPGGGWAFTVSHPRVLIWNRAFGVLLGLVAVALTFAIGRDVSGDARVGLGAALITAVSPALAMDAAKVGVDTLMVTMCLLAMWLALRLHARYSTGSLIAAGLVTGLAVSTKYNAAPIAILPLVVCLADRRHSAGAVLLALATPALGFLIGTPFAIVELPKFLNQMAYETWHYGTAGHGAATGQPGLPQAWFYTRWFASSRGVGVLAVLLAVGGLVECARRRDITTLTFLLFPVLFFALMAAQKVNFTRNVLVLIPAIAILTTLAIRSLSARTPRPGLVAAVAVVVTCAQPAIAAIRSRAPGAPDTRIVAGQWLDQASGPRAEAAVASELSWQFTGAGSRGVTAVDTARMDPLALYMSGFDRLIVDGSFAPADDVADLVVQEHRVPGNKPGGRVLISPEVRIFKLQAPRAAQLAVWLSRPEVSVAPRVQYGESDAVRAEGAARCSSERSGGSDRGGGACLARSRVVRLQLDAARLRPLATPGRVLALTIDLQSPWPDQHCLIEAGAWRSADLCGGRPASAWFTASTPVPADALSRSPLTLVVEQVHALPGERGVRAGLIVGTLRLH